MQNFCFFFLAISSQFFILHLTRVTSLLTSISLHPGHLFFSLKYAIQMPQFIPQGAMADSVIDKS
jgi:hypothetical protein